MAQNVARINAQLTVLSKRLGIASHEYDEACEKAASARSNYDVSKAQAMLRSEQKSIALREAEATVACEAQMRESRIAEALRDALKERIRALEAVLNAKQTQAGFLRDEMRLAGKDY